MMSNYTDCTFFVKINKDVEAASLISLHNNNNKDSEQHDIVTNIGFEAMVPFLKLLLISSWLILLIK